MGIASALAVAGLAAWAWRATKRRWDIERETERHRHLASLGEMSGVLAHEIRNPLASLKGHAQLLQETLDAQTQPKAHAKAERIVSEAVRIEGITTGLLEFVRTGVGQMQKEDLGALIRQVLADAASAETVLAKMPDAPVILEMDSGRMRQVLENIVRNAMEAQGDATADAKEPVEVDLSTAQGRARVLIRDHGQGIKTEPVERIFDPFFTTKTRGTGLGLAVARRITQLHGGTLTASNHPQGGAVFCLEVPLARG